MRVVHEIEAECGTPVRVREADGSYFHDGRLIQLQAQDEAGEWNTLKSDYWLGVGDFKAMCDKLESGELEITDLED